MLRAAQQRNESHNQLRTAEQSTILREQTVWLNRRRDFQTPAPEQLSAWPLPSNQLQIGKEVRPEAGTVIFRYIYCTGEILACSAFYKIALLALPQHLREACSTSMAVRSIRQNAFLRNSCLDRTIWTNHSECFPPFSWFVCTDYSAMLSFTDFPTICCNSGLCLKRIQVSPVNRSSSPRFSSHTFRKICSQS